MTDRLLPSSEACEALGISRSALGQWMDKAWIVGQKMANGAYVFTEGEVARAKAEQLARAAA
jgi:predicted site-specific integrase-resolvase